MHKNLLRMSWCYLFFIVMRFVLSGSMNDDIYPRSKRTLTYIPPGGVIQMVMGVGLPLLVDQESLIVGFVLKGGYQLPYNSSHFTRPNVVYARRNRSFSRWDLYQVMAHFSQMQGFGGKECVLRTICELSNIPIDKSFGILEELIHTVFTPSTTNEPYGSHLDSIYHAAERIGRSNEASCEKFFPECQNSYSKIFTRLHTHNVN